MKNSLGPKTLLYPTPVLVVGTYDANGKANAMVASWGGICCSQPPCINISLRKATYKLLGDRRTQGVSPRAYRMGIHGDRAAL